MLWGAYDPLVVMRRVVDQSLELIPSADGAVVELVYGEQLIYVCAGGSLAGHVGLRLNLDQSLSGLSVRTGRTLHCRDCSTDPRVDRKKCEQVGAVSMVCVPLLRGTAPIGVLKVSAARADAFMSDDVAILSRLAEFIGVAIGSSADISSAVGDLFEGEGGSVEGAGAGLAVGDGSQWYDEAIGAFVGAVLKPEVIKGLAAKRRIEQLLSRRDFKIVVQPIVHLDTGALIGAEALARFPEPPLQSPDVWFDDAARVGLGVPLQLAAISEAAGLLDQLPFGAFLAVNVRPDAITAEQLPALLDSFDSSRLVIELTEHLRIDDYPLVRGVLSSLRELGVRLAIDDIGAGFANLGHIVNLAPDLIKLDRQFTTGIDRDPVRRAVAQALVSLGADTGAQVIAEGIETAAELETVRKLGIEFGQGYYIGRPVQIASMRRRFVGRKPPSRRRSSAVAPVYGLAVVAGT